MLRCLTQCLLVLSLVLTGVSHVHARAADPAVAKIVICRGSLLQIVHLGADGTPTTAPVHCPDCTPGEAGIQPRPAVLVADASWRAVLSAIATEDVVQPLTHVPFARGPPPV